jgi:hypothetical protein
MTKTLIRTWLAAAMLLTALAVTPVSAQTAPSAERAELNKLVLQRNRLVVQLQRLDRQATELIKQNREPVVVHAEQVSVQDQLDLIELRLAILATRHGLAVPPAPRPADGDGPAGAAPGDPSEQRIAKAFSRGRHRAIEQLRRDGVRFLASLDFSEFLGK